jgi:hypothetical protein
MATTKKATVKKTTKRAATKKAKPASKTAKVSPLRGMAVADWLKHKTAGWQTKVIARLLALVAKAAPDATVTIKWAQPVFELNGPMAYIQVAKAHVTFGFWRGAELADPAGLLEGGDRMKHVKIKEAGAIDETQLAAFVRAAADLNRAKGDPTKR